MAEITLHLNILVKVLVHGEHFWSVTRYCYVNTVIEACNRLRC